MVSTESCPLPAMTAAAGTNRASTFLSIPTRTRAYMPGRSSSVGLGISASASMVLEASSSAYANRVTAPVNTRPGISSTVTWTGRPTFTRGTSGSGTGISMRTDLMSIRVSSAAFVETLPDVAAGMNAPGSTERRETIPEKGATILV